MKPHKATEQVLYVYSYVIELHVIGQANEKMRDFLRALRGFGVTGCTVDVGSLEEEEELGNTVNGFEVCLL